ncbi:MAG: dockerin type I domain-containing protein [Clostridiales bacterium]|nr:dockerin type I domain-containing protein [Clostridiales bacterium]
MKRKFVCMVVVLALCIAPCTAFAAPDQGIGATIMTHDLMVSQLLEIDALSSDVELFKLSDRYGPDATAESGKPLYVLKMGDGDIVVWIQARIHGNERITTIGFMDFIWEYIGSAALRADLADLTIYAIPIYNPDGSDRNQRGTVVQPENRLPGQTGVTGPGQYTNYDLNRDWKVDLAGEGVAFGALESKAYYKLFCDIMPDYSLDLHHQGSKNTTPTNGSRIPGYVSGSMPITMSIGTSLYIDGPTLPYIKDYNTKMKQLGGYVFREIADDVRMAFPTPYALPCIDMYSGIEIFGGVVSGMSLGINYEGINPYNHSCPTLFFESDGNNTAAISANTLAIAKQNYLGVMAFCKGIVTGEVLTVDEDIYYNIPYSGTRPTMSPSSRDYDTSANGRHTQWVQSVRNTGLWYYTTKAGLKALEVSGVEGDVEYTLEVYGAKDVLALELEFVIDGPLAGIGVEGINGFEPMSDIFWMYAGNGTWSGSVTMKYEAGDSTGFTARKLADVAKFVYAPTAQGDATMTLTGFRAVGYDGDTTVYLDSAIAIPSVTTTIEQLVWSKYDLNKDNIVDALDLGIMLLYCGFDADSPDWDTLVKVNDSRGRPVTASMCDVNCDGVIDMLDLLDLFIHYTK